ncbi:hypothetical protein SCORR_v1c08180 [Spiroplasma corruscae]|uniref:Uncharacterized protein n=1 Tax=Spiroplasma corruscae TaxID=216934 RepID=A0A222EPX8_9MOLU|nr:MFS cation transporter [Spiroplasma corruscae]ASP28590.1 hypothetical protein SCORR_v1c08180 [Spiroplasma corruscae]
MKNWDLIIMLPILFAMCIFTLIFIVLKEKIKKRQVLFLTSIIFFWMIVGYLSNKTFNTLPTTLEVEKSEFIFLIIFGTSLFLIFLKPFATFITGIIRNRTSWLKVSYAIIFTMVLILTIVGEKTNIYYFIFMSFMLSICIASSTIYFLFYNEQYYYRIYVLPATWIVFSFITFGTTLGLYLEELNTIVIGKTFNYSILGISMFIILCLFIFTSLFIKESRNLAGVFDKEVIDLLPKKNNLNFFMIYLIVFLLSITSSLNNSMIVKLFIGLNLRDYQLDYNQVFSFLRAFNFLYTVPSIIVSYFIYKFVLKYLGQKYLIFTSLFLIFGMYTILAFTTNPYVYTFTNIFTGILMNQILFSLFSLCIMWNYRSPKNPVTGFFGTSFFGAKFLIESTEKIVGFYNKGVFHNVNKISDLETLLVVNSTLLKEFDVATTLIMSFSCMLILICILIFYFRNNSMFADYTSYRNATRNLKNLLKKRILEKAKTKIEV